MENLITILLFLGIAVFTIIRKVGSKQKAVNKAKPTTPPKQGTLAFKINEFIAKVQERIEAETGQGPSSSAEWRELMDDGMVSLQEPETLEDLVIDEVVEPPTQPKRSTTRIPSTPRRKKSPVEPSPVPAPESQAAFQANQLVPRNQSDLRKAIVWAEIIGPPVALRDRQSHH